MDGKNAIILASYKRTSPTTVDVVLDKPGNRLFFSDSYNNLIQYFDVATMRIHTLLSGNLHNPVGLTMQSNILYWTAAGDGPFSGAIFKAETTNQSNAQMIADGFWYPTGIYAYNSSAALTPGSNLKDWHEISLCGSTSTSPSLRRQRNLNRKTILNFKLLLGTFF